MKRLGDRDAFGLLVIAIIVTLLLLSVGGHARIASILTQGAAMILGLLTARAGRRLLILAFCVIVAVAVASILQNGSTGKPYMVTASIGALLLALATIAAIARRVRLHTRITISTVYAAIAVYLLVGLAYAYFYSVLGALSSQPFFADRGSVPEVEYIYFSFTTLTSTGFGDYVAARPLGQMTSVSEAVLGQLYLVTVVAVVVGNLGHARRDPQDY